MAESEDNFISRWSLRKRVARDEAHEEAPSRANAPQTVEESASPAQADSVSEQGTAPVRVEDLPDPDTLTEEADFTVFMKEGVPEVLRRRALRRLWRLNPLYANLDGLNDYDLDYTDAATVVTGLKTLYKVGWGIVLPDENAPTAATDETGADEAPASPDAPGEPNAAIEEQVVVRAEGDEKEESARPSESMAVEIASTPDSSPATDTAPPENARKRGARSRRWGDT